MFFPLRPVDRGRRAGRSDDAWSCVALGGRLSGDADDRGPEEILQRHEEARIKATDEADSKAKGVNSRPLITFISTVEVQVSYCYKSRGGLRLSLSDAI